MTILILFRFILGLNHLSWRFGLGLSGEDHYNSGRLHRKGRKGAPWPVNKIPLSRPFENGRMPDSPLLLHLSGWPGQWIIRDFMATIGLQQGTAMKLWWCVCILCRCFTLFQNKMYCFAGDPHQCQAKWPEPGKYICIIFSRICF